MKLTRARCTFSLNSHQVYRNSVIFIKHSATYGHFLAQNYPRPPQNVYHIESLSLCLENQLLFQAISVHSLQSDETIYNTSRALCITHPVHKSPHIKFSITNFAYFLSCFQLSNVGYLHSNPNKQLHPLEIFLQCYRLSEHKLSKRLIIRMPN